MVGCLTCDKLFKPKVRKNRVQKYCSVVCRIEDKKSELKDYVCSRKECSNTFRDNVINNRKYCSTSCAAITTNKASPKRVRTKTCKTEYCDEKIPSKNSYCENCRSNRTKSYKDNLTKTVGELRNDQSYQAHSYLRNIARLCYKEYGKEFVCYECGYDLHVEICHIKDLYKYSDDSLVSDTTKEDNLVALCRNHHWEFDHGYLEVKGVLK